MWRRLACVRLGCVLLNCAAWLLAGGMAGTAMAEEALPRAYYVNADNVYVRSGPGENYYPTGKLEFGAAVEVYRHDPGGWYAVRPPEGSFSWVMAEYLRPTESRTAVVERDRVVSRVGSMFSDIRDVIQVRLDRGEEVEVLGAKRFGSGPAARTWYKIAPPAGEFRWVYGKFLSDSPPEQEPATRDERRNLLVQQTSGVEGTPVGQANAAPATGAPTAEASQAILRTDQSPEGEVELTGLWPKREGGGFWRQRAANPEAEGRAPAANDDRARERPILGRLRPRAARGEPYREEPPYGDDYAPPEVEGPDEGWPADEEAPRYEPGGSRMARRRGPPVDYPDDGYRVATRDRNEAARVRLSPELHELAESESHDGDAEQDVRVDAPRYGEEEMRDGEERILDEYAVDEAPYDDGGYELPPRMARGRNDARPVRDRVTELDRRRRDARDSRNEFEDDRPAARDERDPGSFQVRLPRSGSSGHSAGGATGPLADELDWIDVQLSALAAEEAELRAYDDLRARAEDLLSRATTPLDRGQARLMLEKIDRFAELSERSVSLARRSRDLGRDTRTARRSRSAEAGPSDSSQASPAARYDGVGQLTEVVSHRPGAPTYALLDERGRIRCYVTPAPGVNLRHYIGQQVGLVGSVGLDADSSQRHVVAQRILSLDDGGSKLR